MSFVFETLQRLWQSLLTSLGLQNKQGSLLLLGLDNAGKTTLLHRLRCDDIQTFPPTDRPTQEVFRVGRIQFAAWDLGGHEAVRYLWEDYVTATGISAVLFVIDAADSERLEEAAYELDALVAGEFSTTTTSHTQQKQQQQHNSHFYSNNGNGNANGGGFRNSKNDSDNLIKGIPIAILLNKCDLPEAMSTEDICERLDYDTLKRMHNSDSDDDDEEDDYDFDKKNSLGNGHVGRQSYPDDLRGDNKGSSLDKHSRAQKTSKMEVFRISVLRGEGYQEAFRWLSTFL